MPRLAWSEVAVSREARELRAGARSAGRAVVGFAGAEDKVAAVNARRGRSVEQFHVIDLFSLSAGDAILSQSASNGPGIFGEEVAIFES
jgi:hypothetical protein